MAKLRNFNFRLLPLAPSMSYSFPTLRIQYLHEFFEMCFASNPPCCSAWVIYNAKARLKPRYVSCCLPPNETSHGTFVNIWATSSHSNMYLGACGSFKCNHDFVTPSPRTWTGDPCSNSSCSDTSCICISRKISFTISHKQQKVYQIVSFWDCWLTNHLDH